MTAPYTNTNTETYLRIADKIGQRLSREAIWYEGRCNWVGAEPVDQSSMDGTSSVVYRTLGSGLYLGTSGIALFLAELHAATGDAAVRRTALGAIRQAFGRADAIPPSIRLGLHTGWLGIALVAARLGTVLGEEALLDRATRLSHRAALEITAEHEFDLISGNAGAIAALVILQDLLDDASLLDFAVQLGDELLQTAEGSEAGYSWKSSSSPHNRNLTGFSHGTAGVGYALLELFLATGDARYRSAAEYAFRYERHWFDVNARNWPDFRHVPARGKYSRGPFTFATQWCHGAPGIALSRLRAYEILKEEICKGEALTALEITRMAVGTALRHSPNDFSLCHGLAGNAEVLLYGWQMLGREITDMFSLATQVADCGAQIYAARGLPWPCGIPSGETPNLMLGLAGIGHFYLRLHNPTTPSILLLQREDFLNGYR
jgi:lantibiotic biosynthesis protein